MNSDRPIVAPLLTSESHPASTFDGTCLTVGDNIFGEIVITPLLVQASEAPLI